MTISFVRFIIGWIISWSSINANSQPFSLLQAEVLFRSGMICLQLNNSQQANVFFQKSADLFFPAAMKSLADSYWSGDGIELNPTKAMVLYLLSADRGYGTSQLTVGLILSKNEKGYVNSQLASLYFKKALANPQLETALKEIAQEGLKELESIQKKN